MTQRLKSDFKQVPSSTLDNTWGFRYLVHGASEHLLIFTASAVAVTWVPLLVLSALRGESTLLSFLTDYASQSRFLIVLPVLILGAPKLHQRLAGLVHHLDEFIPERQLSTFSAGWGSFERLGSSTPAKVVIVLLTYAIAVCLGQIVSPQGAEIVDWWRGSGGFRWFSLAGTWALFVSYPITVFFTLLWLWRQSLWTRFMRTIAQLELRLIAAHPDGVGGIGFLESALRGQQPFSFCLGVALAGAVANRMFHHGQKLTSFIDVAAVLVGAVLLICVAPYFTLTPVLMRMRRSGMLRYGSFARAVGERFEKKWLGGRESLDQNVLMVVDFSALNDLYGVVRNVNDVSVLPVGRVDLYGLLAAAFVPAIPVVIGSVPFDVVARAAAKMLF